MVNLEGGGRGGLAAFRGFLFFETVFHFVVLYLFILSRLVFFCVVAVVAVRVWWLFDCSRLVLFCVVAVVAV